MHGGIPVAYIRRSVARKSDPGDISRQFQTAKVRELAGDDGPSLRIIDQDWGRSAARDKTDKRLAFLDLMRAVEAGHVSTVYAYSADRLARSVRWAAQLLDLCEDAGTTIITSEGRFAPGDTGARMVFQVLAIGNEHALTSIVQKSTSGVAARRARGDDLGSFRYGYKTNKDTRRKGETVSWVRDPDAPLDQVLAVVEAHGGNILASCRELDRLEIRPPKGGKRWATSALTRIVEREAPGLRPRRTITGQRAPTRSVLSQLVRCPTCGAMMTPVGTREALYCRFGSRDLTKFRKDSAQKRPGTTVHAKYFTKDGPILKMLHDATDGRTVTKFRVSHRSADAAAHAKAEERWRRANVRYQAGGISDDDFAAEAARWKVAKAAAEDAEDGWGLDRAEGEPLVRWDADPVTVNADLRRIFAEVRLDPVDLSPVELVRTSGSRRGRPVSPSLRAELEARRAAGT